MKIEFKTRRDFNLITELCRQSGCDNERDIFVLPSGMGTGYIKMLDLEPGLKLVIHRHILNEELIIKRKSSDVKNSLITITFNTIDRPLVFVEDTQGGNAINLSSIYITSTDIGLETKFLANKNIHSTIVVIHGDLLLNLLAPDTDNNLIKNITGGIQSFWYDTGMTPQIQELLFQLDDPDGKQQFTHLFYRIKIQQLIYQLFVHLSERENTPFHSLNGPEIEKMYLIRETLLSALNRPPVLNDLARKVCMSETKMKSLFRQIFGKSIYNYYQCARMDEAARLLKNHTVAETGYKLGFSTTSYFSELFEKYRNMRPKKFKDML